MDNATGQYNIAIGYQAGFSTHNVGDSGLGTSAGKRPKVVSPNSIDEAIQAQSTKNTVSIDAFWKSLKTNKD